MEFLIKPDTTLGRQIEQASCTAAAMCWTCGSCDPFPSGCVSVVAGAQNVAASLWMVAR